MITYPLNHIEYTAEDAELYLSTRKSGVYDGEDFEITVSGIDNNVVVGEGISWIQNTKFSGKVAALKEPKTLTLDLADSVYDRIDAIVIQFDASENGSNVIVKKGTASSAPVAPSVSRTESLYELHIYHIYRKAGATTIGVDDVTDQRKNPDYCGIMFDPVAAIDDTLSKRGFAADAEAVGTAIENSRVSMTLLWENASPASTFGATTISNVDIRPYKRLIIEYIFSPDYFNHYTVYVPVNDTIDKVMTVPMYIVSTANKTGYRPVDAELRPNAMALYPMGCIIFGDAKYNDSTSNKYSIPVRIWGIKGV